MIVPNEFVFSMFRRAFVIRYKRIHCSHIRILCDIFIFNEHFYIHLSSMKRLCNVIRMYIICAKINCMRWLKNKKWENHCQQNGKWLDKVGKFQIQSVVETWQQNSAMVVYLRCFFFSHFHFQAKSWILCRFASCNNSSSFHIWTFVPFWILGFSQSIVTKKWRY